MKKRADYLKENVVLVRYSEIFLKSRPVLKRMENLLLGNIQKVLKGKSYQLEIIRGRIFLHSNSPSKIIKKLKYVFGVYSYSPAVCINTTDPEKIKEIIKENYEEKIGNEQSFALRIKVAQEGLDSRKIAEIVGAGINRRVDLEHPDKEIFLEIRGGKTYVFEKIIKGLGGLPIGASGKVVSLISGGIDSPVASWLIMKRGCEVAFVHFYSFPLVSKRSYQKTVRLVRVLNKYQGKSKIYFVPFAQIQSWLRTNVDSKYLVIFYRRLMFKIAQELAKESGAKALVTGESLGQVASQTLDNLGVINEAVKIPILRPLISFDKEEIINLAQKINTYKISIEPQDDCCTLFVPRHPATQAKLSKIKEEEKKIPLRKLINQALKETELIMIK